MESTIKSLEGKGQLDEDSADELSKRLNEAQKALARGDAAEARDKLSDFAEKVVSLREEDELSEGGYQVILGLMTQLGQALPRN